MWCTERQQCSCRAAVAGLGGCDGGVDEDALLGPLLETYVRLWPPSLREQATRAFASASRMIVGWMWSNVVIGALEAVVAGIFLSLMGGPAALVWAALAFFAELVPKLGPYLMAIPPVLVSLAVEPETALWVALFYLVLNELMGDLVMPRVRAATMDIHPVSILFVMLALASAFGLVGALVATPMTAFIKAYVEEFYLARQPADTRLQARVSAMLVRRVGSDGRAQSPGDGRTRQRADGAPDARSGRRGR